MSFDWGELLWLAEELQVLAGSEADQCRCEVLQRASIGRAYYCIYKLAEKYHNDHWGRHQIRPEDVTPAERPKEDYAKWGSHKLFAFSFGQQLEKHVSDSVAKQDLLLVKQNLVQLLAWRTKADYKDRFDDISSRAPMAVNFARSSVNTLRSYTASSR